MSVNAMAQVWTSSKHKGSDLLVLLAIADHAKDDGTGAWPSIDGLARKTRLSERNVHYSIKRLEASGELVVEKNAGPKGTNLYHVTVFGCKLCTPDTPIPSGAKSAPAKIAPVQNSTDRGANSAPGGVQPIAPEPSLEPSIESSEKKTKKGAAPPENLLVFDSILREAGNGQYQPTIAFYSKVEGKYAGLDLEEEAIKLTSWLQSEKARKLKRTCNTGFVLNWLKNASEERRSSGTAVTGNQRAGERESDAGNRSGAASPFAKYG